MMDEDIVRAFFRRVQTVATGISDSEWQRLEGELRQEWAGERVYIAARPRDPGGKLLRLTVAVAAGAPFEAACSAAGVSRSWGYELRRRLPRWQVRPVSP